MTQLEFPFIYSKKFGQRIQMIVIFSSGPISAHNRITCPSCEVFPWQDTMWLYVWHTGRLMGLHGRAERTIEGPAVTHSPIARRAVSTLVATAWRQWHISFLNFNFFEMYAWAWWTGITGEHLSSGHRHPFFLKFQKVTNICHCVYQCVTFSFACCFYSPVVIYS